MAVRNPRFNSNRPHDRTPMARRLPALPCPAGPTNAAFAKTDAAFREACEQAGIEPTIRQASKFRRGFGLAFTTRKSQPAPAVPTPAPAVEPEPETVDLATLAVAALRTLARERGATGYSKLRKAELLALLSE